MPFNLDNQTLLYVIIGLFVVQLLITKYYTQYSIEETVHRNNKKLVKKLATQVNDTFEQYMGRNRSINEESKQMREEREYEVPQRGMKKGKEEDDGDSIEDPAEDEDK